MQFIEMQFNGGGIKDSKMHKWVYKKKIHAMDSCKRHALHTHTHTCSHAISNTCKVMCRVHKRNKQEIRRGARVNIRTHIEHSKQQRTELFDPNMNKTGKVVRKW